MNFKVSFSLPYALEKVYRESSDNISQEYHEL